MLHLDLIFGDSCQWNRFAFECTTAHGFQCGVVNGHTFHSGPLVVAIGKVVLCKRAGQVFHKQNRVVTVFGVLGNCTTGNVHVGAPCTLVGEHNAHFFHGGAVFWVGGAHHARDVIGIGQRYPALARSDGFDLIGVATLGRARHVVNHAFEECFCLGFAHVFHDGREQAQVIGV